MTTTPDLPAEAEAAATADPIAALEWRRLTPAERAQVVRDAAAFRAAHDRQVGALGPHARTAHAAICPRCEEEEAAQAAKRAGVHTPSPSPRRLRRSWRHQLGGAGTEPPPPRVLAEEAA